MARLASQAKAGFYPTPDKVCGLLKEIVSIEEGARLLDPCCGRGKTLSSLAHNAETFGIELDHLRADSARRRLTRVLWGDALSEIRISPASFSLLYLNPPYDYEMAMGDRTERLEAGFLRRYKNVLQNHGWLILVIPYPVLRFCATFLARHFEMHQIFAFPEAEFQSFRQCVVLARRCRLVKKSQARKVQNSLTRLADYEPDEFLDIVPGLEKAVGIIVPPATGRLVTFKSDRVDPLEIVPLAARYGLLDDVLTGLVPGQRNQIRPLAPLENGHLALMLAGGYMNGEIVQNNRRLVIKGVVTKEEKVRQVSENSAGATMVVTRDQYTPTVRAIDLARAEMITIQ